MHDVLPVFLINLDRDQFRLVAMEREFSSAGHAFERLGGVHGLALPDELRPFFLDETGDVASHLTNGEVGCYASHLVAMQTMLDRGLPLALIVEDDIAFEAGAFNIIDAALAAAPVGWDFIRLSNPTNSAYCALASFLGHDLVVYSRIPDIAAAYLVSAAGARKFLEAGLRFRPIDEDFRYAHEWNLQVYGVLPAPVRANIFPTSSIEEMGTRKRKKPGLLGRLRQRANKLTFIIRRDAFFARQVGLKNMLECRARTRLCKMGFSRRFLRMTLPPPIGGP